MNRKIPIASSESLHFDDEENGVRYFIKPITGRNGIKLTVITSSMDGASIVDKVDGICDIVDLFLIDVQSIDKSIKFPKKPDGIKYSDVLDVSSINFVYFKIIKESGLLVEEKKSSSQPLGQSSGESTTQNTIADSAGVPEDKIAE